MIPKLEMWLNHLSGLHNQDYIRSLVSVHWKVKLSMYMTASEIILFPMLSYKNNNK